MSRPLAEGWMLGRRWLVPGGRLVCRAVIGSLIATGMIAAVAIAADPPGTPRPSPPNRQKNSMQPSANQRGNQQPVLDANGDPLPTTLEGWQQRLSPEQFQVARLKGTERAFTGKYWNTKTPGTYRCICCGEPLFRSDEKFDSGCGWPSFNAPIDAKQGNVKGQAVAEHDDFSFFMQRTEVTCRKCGAHLGHVFNDGPPPTGLRYGIHSASLVLEERKPGAVKPSEGEPGSEKPAGDDAAPVKPDAPAAGGKPGSGPGRPGPKSPGR